MDSKSKYFYLSIISSILFIFFRFFYRNYIYSHNIFDFYIADTAPNIFPVFMYVFYKKHKEPSINVYLLCLGAFLGLTFYELFIQKHIYNATLDINDIIASLLASLVALLICNKIDYEYLDISDK